MLVVRVSPKQAGIIRQVSVAYPFPSSHHHVKRVRKTDLEDGSTVLDVILFLLPAEHFPAAACNTANGAASSLEPLPQAKLEAVLTSQVRARAKCARTCVLSLELV